MFYVLFPEKQMIKMLFSEIQRLIGTYTCWKSGPLNRPVPLSVPFKVDSNIWNEYYFDL